VPRGTPSNSRWLGGDALRSRIAMVAASPEAVAHGGKTSGAKSFGRIARDPP